jgi:predicted polyphosphate/ATP-dependent NAD kinase
VNPIAGVGGTVGLKGSDGPATVTAALARGARPVAGERMGRALQGLSGAGVGVLAAPGAMGADAVRSVGLAVVETGAAIGTRTTAADTRAAAAEMRRRGVALLLFAGGDGTARDIVDAVGSELPLLGVPAGVKMHSGVFAATPDAAGRAAAAYLAGGVALCDVDIADMDEDAARADRIATRLYGSARIPDQPRLILSAKTASGGSPQAAVATLCRELAEGMQTGRLYLIGPGTTTAGVLAALGLRGTLLGVDAVRDGRLAGVDLDEAGLLGALERARDAELIVGLVGGQGALFGRGNRQLTPAVLRRVGRERITILSAADKLLALPEPVLRVDTGDDALDAQLCGYVRVHVAPRRTIVMNVSD